MKLPATRHWVVAVAVAALPGGLRQTAAPRPFRLAAPGPLGDLLPLPLVDECAGRKDEPPDRGVFEALGSRRHAGAGAFCFVEEDSGLILIAGEAVDRVGEDDIG